MGNESKSASPRIQHSSVKPRDARQPVSHADAQCGFEHFIPEPRVLPEGQPGHQERGHEQQRGHVNEVELSRALALAVERLNLVAALLLGAEVRLELRARLALLGRQHLAAVDVLHRARLLSRPLVLQYRPRVFYNILLYGYSTRKSTRTVHSDLSHKKLCD